MASPSQVLIKKNNLNVGLPKKLFYFETVHTYLKLVFLKIHENKIN